MRGRPSGESPIGSDLLYRIAHGLGQLTEAIGHLRSDVLSIHTRLESGEQRMDWLSEENIRRQMELAALSHPPEAQARSSSPVRLIYAVMDVIRDLLSEKGARFRWVMILVSGWLIGHLHLPHTWNEALQATLARFE